MSEDHPLEAGSCRLSETLQLVEAAQPIYQAIVQSAYQICTIRRPSRSTYSKRSASVLYSHPELRLVNYKVGGVGKNRYEIRIGEWLTDLDSEAVRVSLRHQRL